MTEVARRHSADMFTRGYFSHNTPENKTPLTGCAPSMCVSEPPAKISRSRRRSDRSYRIDEFARSPRQYFRTAIRSPRHRSFRRRQARTDDYAKFSQLKNLYLNTSVDNPFIFIHK
jgi:hypothetical protein